MIILIPVNGFIANKIKTLQIRQMKNKDERVKLMNEILGGIKVLKLYAWEPSFEEQVLKIREKEIKVLRQAAYLNAGTSFIWSCAPFMVRNICPDLEYENNFNLFLLLLLLFPKRAQIIFCFKNFSNQFPINQNFNSFIRQKVSIVTFVTYLYTGDDHILTAEKAFVCLTLFDIIKLPLAMLPLLIVYMLEVIFQQEKKKKRFSKITLRTEMDFISSKSHHSFSIQYQHV